MRRLNENSRKDLDRGLRVSPKPKDPVFRRKRPDPWHQVKKQDQADRVRASRPQIPK